MSGDARRSAAEGPDWAFKLKWDGYRLAVQIEPERVRLIARGGYDWSDRFLAIVAEARRLMLKTAMLDGETVVRDERGRSEVGAAA